MLTQCYAADFDLDPVLLTDDPPENRSEQFPKLLRAHRRQTQGKLFRRGEESARNFGPFSGKVQPIEDFGVGFEKGEDESVVEVEAVLSEGGIRAINSKAGKLLDLRKSLFTGSTKNQRKVNETRASCEKGSKKQ